MALTDTKIRKAKSTDKPYKLFDGHGLFLLVHSNGSKYWRWQYAFGGKRKLYAIGVYPSVSLADARAKRDQAQKLLRNGRDPVQAKREAKRQAEAKSENSFERIAREWHDQKKESWTARHSAKVLRSLEEVFRAFGSKAITEVTAPEILEVVRRVEKRNAVILAARVLQRISAVFRYAISCGYATSNPAGDLRGSLKTRKVTHRAALSRAELPEFLERLEAYDGHATTRWALKLMVLTFVRSNELRGARWEEFDIDRAEWIVPASRVKMGSDHVVPLARQALEVLDELRPLTGSYDLLFPNIRDVTRPISENALLFAMYRLGYHQRATVHGFRAVASTLLNEFGWRADVVERQLGHVERNQVRAAYHRGQYLEDRRKMMQAWADYLDGLMTGANVIPLRA